MATVRCPACFAKHVFTRVVTDRYARGGARTVPVGPCVECGWAREPAVPRDKWRTAAHLPRPARMPAEEFAMRARLFELWANHTVREFLSQLPVFADYLADRGSPEEVAARADWRPYGHKKTDPKKWWSWSVSAGEGWTYLQKYHDYPDGPPRYGIRSRARTEASRHNGEWFLHWPPGFVRFGAPLHHDHTRWRITVSHRRTAVETPSRPIERTWLDGYSTLLRPYADRIETDVQKPKVRHAAEGPTLFDDL